MTNTKHNATTIYDNNTINHFTIKNNISTIIKLRRLMTAILNNKHKIKTQKRQQK
jgi:hypothetical protein